MSVMQEYLKKYGNSTVSTPRMTAPVSSAGAGNGTMSEYLKWLEEEEERKRLQQAMNRNTLGLGNDDDEDEDIAPVDDSLLDFFQKGSFSDGFDWHDIPTAILGTAGDAALNVAKGALGIVEGVADLGVYGVAGVADALGHDEYAEGARRRASENLIDKVTGGAEDYLNKYSVLGRTADSAMQGVGQMLTNVLLGGAGQAAGLGKVGLTALTSAVTGVSGVGHGMSEAYQGGATDEEATTYGLISGAADALTEWMFDGMGQAVNALGYNRGLFSADDLLAKKASSMFSSQIAKNMVEFGIKSSAEGLEEVVAGIAQGIGKKLTYMSEESIWDILRDENLLEQFVTGAVSSGFAQSGIVPGMKQGSLIESNQTGRDFVTGYTQTEQTIIDKAVENRIKAREENGQTVTHKDKTEIESEVKRLLDKGYLDADEIESILGGEEYTSVKNELSNFFASDDYKAYKQAEKAEADARAEFDPLVKMKQGEMTGEQIYRRDELKKMLDESKVGELKSKVAPEATRIAQLRNKMRGNVQSMVQGTRMAESYNELARKQQKFQVDVNQYADENAKKTVQSILDSGLGDNSNQFHETVDFLAKLSADKGVVFDLTNNEKLKGTEHYKEGYWTHGFVSDDGNIVLNYDSPRALNTTVGHEITHVLEKAGVYGDLQKAVFNYAISKEGQAKFDARLAEAREIYKGKKNTTAEGEVTADIIGEYLFTDYEFISNLSTSNRNVFQKIYDEIKYMVKIATAGSNEARELLKAKKMFDKAYRENVKGKGEGTQHSYSGINSETADSQKLAEAEELLSSGVDAETIRKETGWFKGYDGKWRYEVNDSEMEVLKNLTSGRFNKYIDGEMLRLDDIIKHDALFEAYPSLRETTVQLKRTLGKNIVGSYSADTDTLSVSGSIYITDEMFKEMLIHEVQHKIQNIEGFARGSSPKYWEKKGIGEAEYDKFVAESEREKARILRGLTSEERQDYLRYVETDKQIKAALEAVDTDAILRGDDTNAMNALASVEEIEAENDALYNKLYSADWFAKLQEIDDVLDEGISEKLYTVFYKNTAGEIEARDVSKRVNYTEAQRMDTRPDIDRANVTFAKKGDSLEYIGDTKDGRRCYKSGFDSSVSMDDRIAEFKKRIATIFNLGAVELKTDVKKIRIRGDRFTSQKNLYGDEYAEPGELSAKVNALYDLADILATAKYDPTATAKEPSYANPALKPKNKAHKDVKYWYKFRNEIVFDGVPFYVTFNIRDKGGEQYQYLINFKENKTPGLSNTAVKSLLRADQVSYDATVAQNDTFVNPEFATEEADVTETDDVPYSMSEVTEEQNEQGLDRVSETQYSLSKDTEFSNNAIKKNQEKLLVDAEAMTAAKELRERIASRMNDIKDRGLVALPEDMEGNTYIANSSYDGTEENTTICPRSLASEAFVDAVSEYLGRPLTVEEQIYISQDLQGRSLTPECTYCYVATDRKAYRAFLGEYINQRDAVIEKIKANPNADVSKSGDLYREFLNGRKDTKPMYNRFKMWVDAYQNGTPMVEASHLANISKLMGDIKEFGEDLKPQIVDAMKYAQSASWAKKRVSYVAYNGHILKWKDDRIKKLNSHYGLRMYSFSDFHPAFVLENMQMITDASVRGLKMLGYTKDTDFVEIFAPSGMNINISTFGFETDGNVYENNIIGAEWAKAQELRSQYPNVGITFVATNDTLVEWALDQDWIDVVIPYHLVRTGAEVAKAFGYTNYTSESSDTKTSEWKKGDKKSIAPTEHNNDFQTYMDALAKNHLNPRFERFKDNPNYMKLVNECRQSASQSKPVQPVFNEDAAMVALAKLEANGYYQPIGGSVDRMYEIASEVAEDMTKNIAPTKYSMSKDSEGNQVTAEQEEFFKDSKLRDENGRLMPMYHGTNNPDFTVFDPQFSDDKISLFFTSDPEVANTYTTAQDYGRDVDPYNLITKDSSAEQFNKAQERVGGGLRVVKVTDDWIAEMKQKARHAKQDYIIQVYELVAEIEKASRGDVAPVFDFYLNSIREELASGNVHGSNLGYAINKLQSNLSFLKNRKLEREISTRLYDTKKTLDKVRSYEDSIVGEEYIGQYVYTETNSMVPFVARGKTDSYFTHIIPGTESELVEKALDRMKWVKEHNLGNRYKVYLNLTNPYIIDTGTDYSGMMDAVSIKKGYGGTGWEVEMENAEDDLVKYMTTEEFTSFLDSAFDVETTAKIKSQIEADNEAYRKEWDDLDPEYVEHDIQLENVNIRYVEPGKWSSLKFNGMEDAKTRDVAKWAKENGYDGVIFKNMRDSGGYAAYRGRGASTVAVAFDSNKVKSVDNVNPTADPDIRYSISKEGAEQSIHGDYHVYGSDFGVNDPLADFAPVADTAPVSGTAENASIQPKMQLTDEKDAAPVADGIQIRTVKERLNAKLNNRQTELANIEKHRADSLKSLDEKIAKAQATLDGKKNKDTKVANTLKKRIERLQRLKADIDAGYAKRINDIKKSIDKTSVELEKDHTERDRYERAVARINAMLKHETEALNAEYAQKKSDLQSRLADKNSYISNTARELYDEIRGLRKGVRASEKLASLLDGGFDWGNLRSALSNVRYTPNQTVNPNSVEERAVRQLLNESYEADMESINDLDVELAEKVHQLEVKAEEDRKNARTANQRKLKMEEHSQFWSDLIGDTSTWRDLPWGLAYKTRTLRRILRKVVKDGNGNADIAKADAIYDALETKYDHNEALLKKESQRLKEVFFKLKLTHEEDAYAQMLGELRHNPDTTLTEDVVRDFYNKHKGKIDTNKVDRAIAETRRTYDELFDRLNAALREQGMKEIPYRQGYFPHFTNPKQNWFEKLMNWKHIDTEIPTSIAGLTDQFKPQRSWQSFNKQRMGDKTDYSLYQGLDTYIHGALDWIYHIDDLQSRRALENHLRYTHSDEGIKARIEEIKANDTYDADEAQKMIDGVLAEANNPLGGLVRELMNRTNTLANKKSSMDRGMEDFTNRKIYSTLTNLNNRITANQVVGSLSSALTNFIPMVQSWHQVSPFYTVRGLGDMIRSTVQDDGMVAKSDFLTNRLIEEEKLYKTGWDKVTDKAAFMMNVVDNITSQTVWRSKYLQNLHEGMSEAQAIRDADQFAKNLMAGRSRGNAPTIFDAKNPIVKIFTAFQLEVSNQYGYMFEDVPQDTESKARLVKGYATAFLGAYMYNALYSSLVGRDAAFDPISIIEDLLKDLFGDDEEEPEEIIMNLADNILEEVPYIGGLLGGGRIPMSSALPYGTDSTPFESMLTDVSEGNWKSLGKQMLKPLYYLAMPVAGGQIKKTAEGLGMFLGDHPITGSYTDSGKLRFPVEATFGNVLQAGLFGQYASQNAREYFDEERSPLGENQIEEFMESGLPIHDYWEYREGLSGLSKLDEKADYIAGLDLPIDTKNLFINNIADRSEDIDLTGYNAFGDFEEFDFAVKYPEKYEIAQAVGGYEAYMTYQEGMKDMKLAEKVDYVAGLNLTIEQKNALINGETDRKEPIDLTGYENFSSFAEFEYAQNNPESYAVAQAVGGYDDFMVYKDELGDIHADRDEYGQSISGSRKNKVWAYIYSLDIPEIQQHILFKMEYNSDDEHNEEIIEYLNRRKDISAEEMTAILLQLGFLVDSEGNIYW